jgi:NADH-quinone oxidoreductase subunit C
MIEYIERIEEKIAQIDSECELIEHHSQYTAIVSKNQLRKILTELKHGEFNFDQLVDITAVDYENKREDFRFEIVYILYSIENKYHYRIKTRHSEDFPVVGTVSDIYESANWYERETWDMYGIKFENHPDHRRFYMPEDFNHPETGESLHPLRKEFPLMGIEGSIKLPVTPEREMAE